MADWRTPPGYKWCMVDGAIVEVDEKGLHRDPDNRRCPGHGCAESHRPVAVQVTGSEYPEMKVLK
jgi:hypothetical protein